MKKEKIIFYDRKKKYSLNVEEQGFFGKFIGLMFSKREKARALLFNFKKKTKISLHSLFVFYPFLVLWLDEKNNVVGKRVVRSFKLSIKAEKDFYKIVEIPLNKYYSKIVSSLVDV